MIKRIRFYLSLIVALIAAFTFQVNDSLAATYKEGYATFKNYFQTESFSLKKGVYTYKDKSYHSSTSKKSIQYQVCIFKGSTPSNCKSFVAYAKSQGHIKTFKITTSGNYKIRFTNVPKSGKVHVIDYVIAK